MKLRTKVLIVTLLVAVPAFILGPVLFTPADVGSEPSAAQIPFFMFLGAADAILLGLGVSFLVFGLPVLRMVSPDSRVRAWAMYLAIGYLMVSWWPHLNLHMSTPIQDWQMLLYIDFLFHLPLEIAGAVLAYCAFSTFMSWRGGKLAEAIQAEAQAVSPETTR
ncbi:MAG: hypothetical protein H0V83_14405 [Rubrobacter sp.]|nr:hypothetical protein [Rubrobacter sp.]